MDVAEYKSEKVVLDEKCKICPTALYAHRLKSNEIKEYVSERKKLPKLANTLV